MNTEMLPWLASSWEKLNEARRLERLPHALLISGAEGGGKRRLAERLAHVLLCEAEDVRGHACGHCAACHWLQAGSHPDLLEQVPEEAGKAIKVDEIRALTGHLVMTSHAGRYKVAIISPAEALNVNAANSLLKTLEEPTDNTILILLSAIPGRLPATIRSRCQQLQLPLPGTGEAHRWLESEGIEAGLARRWLKLARGAPLKALELARGGQDTLHDQRLGQLQQIFDGQLDPVLVAATWVAEHEQAILE